MLAAPEPEKTPERRDIVGLVVVAALAIAASAAYFLVRDIALAWRSPVWGGAPVAHDFSLFWTAGGLAASEGVGAVYDLARLDVAGRALFGPRAFVAVWPYPPPFAYLMSYFGELSYGAALALWLPPPILGLGLWLGWATRSWPAVLMVLGSPALLMNVMIGQAAPWFALLLGAGLLLAARRARYGGSLIGLLVLKPHLAIVAPVALAAMAAWRAFAAAALTALAIVLLSIATHGTGPWLAWLEALNEASRLAATAGVDARSPSVQAAARMLGAGPGLALSAQIVTAIAVLAAVALIWRGAAVAEDKLAVALLAAPLLPPYLWHYDSLVVAVAVAFVLPRPGWAAARPIAAACLIAAWAAPLVNLVGAASLPLPAIAVATLAAFAALVGAALRANERGGGAPALLKS